MNKIDLFKQKLVRKPIAEYWPEFQSSKDDYQAAIQLFTRKFLAVNNAKDRAIHVRCTNATDTESFKRTLQGIEDLLLDHIARAKEAPFRGSQSEAQAKKLLRRRVRQYLGLDGPPTMYKFRSSDIQNLESLRNRASKSRTEKLGDA